MDWFCQHCGCSKPPNEGACQVVCTMYTAVIVCLYLLFYLYLHLKTTDGFRLVRAPSESIDQGGYVTRVVTDYFR
jgi:hypothetical protein